MRFVSNARHLHQHTHTRTHTHTHRDTHTDTHRHTQTHTHKHTNTHTCVKLEGQAVCFHSHSDRLQKDRKKGEGENASGDAGCAETICTIRLQRVLGGGLVGLNLLLIHKLRATNTSA